MSASAAILDRALPGVRVRRSSRSAMLAGAGMVGLVAVAAVLPFLVYASVTDSLVNLFVFVALASTWNLLAGFAGLVSVGQQAYVGIGAYTVVVLADQGVQPYLAVPLAAVTAVVFSVPTSWLAFRLRGDYFAIGTWVIAEVYRLVTQRLDFLGGASGKALTGLSGIDPALRGALTYWVALALAVVTVMACSLLLRARPGLALMAVRDEETAANAVGIDVGRAKRLVYVLAAAGAGASGGVIVVANLSVNPDAIYSVQWSAYMIFIAVIGGMGYLEGPLLGAVVFFALQQALADQGSWYLVILGVVGIVVAVTMPRGLWGLASRASHLSLFPVGYHLLPSTPPAGPPAGRDEAGSAP